MLTSRYSLIKFLFFVVFLCSCTASPVPKSTKELKLSTQHNLERKIIHCEPEMKPEWISSLPTEDRENEYFIGISSHFFTSKPDARNDAMHDAIQQFLLYVGASPSIHDDISKMISGDLSQGLVNNRERNIFRRIKAKKSYFEEYETTRNGAYENTEYKYYILLSVPLDVIEYVQEWLRSR